MSQFDLHMHSSYSNDGEFTPQQLIQQLKAKNIKVAALSDHNCMLGLDEMQEAGKNAGIHIIPAMEFDTLFGDIEVHLLGYNFDYHQPYFKEIDQAIKNLQADLLQERIDFFKSFYQIEINEEEILKDIGTSNPFNAIVDAMLHDPNNKHIEAFQPFLPGGERCDSPITNFFWDTCAKGKPGYFKVAFPDFKKTIDLIHEHGGTAIIAHPWRTFYKREDLLEEAVACGIDGLEAYSNYHNEQENTFYDQYCKKTGLLMTCGSDFHGRVKPNIQLGEYGYHKDDEEIILTTFLNYLNKLK